MLFFYYILNFSNYSSCFLGLFPLLNSQKRKSDSHFRKKPSMYPNAKNGSVSKECGKPGHPCSKARFNPLISIFVMPSIAFITRCDFSLSGSLNSSPRTVGMICQETPYLSLSQPHCCFSPPSESFFHKSSTSSWDTQLTKRRWLAKT